MKKLFFILFPELKMDTNEMSEEEQILLDEILRTFSNAIHFLLASILILFLSTIYAS